MKKNREGSICFIQFSQSFGQGSIALYEYARYLEIMNYKVKFINITTAKKENADSIYVKNAKKNLFSYPRLLFKTICKIRKKGKFDIIHVGNSPGMFLIKIFGGKRNSHWILDIRTGPIAKDRRKKIIISTIVNIVFFPNCLFLSPGLKAIYKKYLKNKKSKIIPLGANLDIIAKQPYPKRLAKKLKIEQNDFTFIYIGSLDATRHPNIIIDGFIKILSKNSKIKFIVVGGGSELEKLKKVIINHSLENQIIMTDKVDYKKIPSYLRLAKVGIAFIPMTKEYDVQPALKTIEYMAAFLPVIGTNTGGNRGFIKDRFNGILIQDDAKSLNNAINFLYKNPMVVKKMGKEAFITAQKYSWRKIVSEELIPFYEKLIEDD